MIPLLFKTVIVGLTVVVPICLIYKKAGFSPYWAGLVFIPVFGLLLVFLQLALWSWKNTSNNQGEG